MSSESFALVIGRFQPFHKAHYKLIDTALNRYDKVLVLIGSYRQARDSRNPFTYPQREEMISFSFPIEKRKRLLFAPVRDYLYNDSLWVSEVQRMVDEATNGSHINLVGHDRDASSSYLKQFPQWGFEEVGKFENDISATMIRDIYLTDQNWSSNGGSVLSGYLPEYVTQFLFKFKETQAYTDLVNEHMFIKRYKMSWKDAPYAPTFVTTDCVVVKSGHVLVVRRKAMPGKGLMALPGGFLQQNETIEEGAIRELKEETGIGIPRDQLYKSIVDRKVFDHPLRSLRGRTITHAFCVNLGSGNLPKVKGMDDAEKAHWIPLHEAFASDDQFFEDHWHIINFFLSKF